MSMMKWGVLPLAIAIGFIGILISSAAGQSAESLSQAYPLDKYPGLGRSPEARFRDDTIAYWEAYRRERLVQDCMRAAGVDSFEVEVQFPAKPVIAIAKELNVTPSRSNVTRGHNDKMVDMFSKEEADHYYQTLMGESLASIEAFESSGGKVPSSASNSELFAQGGCVGKAAEAIPGIWSLKRQLAPELAAIRSEAEQKASATYGQCSSTSLTVAADSPGELESLLAEVEPESAAAEAIIATLDRCSTPWREAYVKGEHSAAREIADRPPLPLKTLSTEYDGILPKLNADPEFRNHLAKAAAEAAGQN